jgi:hypothetical protein
LPIRPDRPSALVEDGLTKIIPFLRSGTAQFQGGHPLDSAMLHVWLLLPVAMLHSIVRVLNNSVNKLHGTKDLDLELMILREAVLLCRHSDTDIF